MADRFGSCTHTLRLPRRQGGGLLRGAGNGMVEALRAETDLAQFLDRRVVKIRLMNQQHRLADNQ